MVKNGINCFLLFIMQRNKRGVFIGYAEYRLLHLCWTIKRVCSEKLYIGITTLSQTLSAILWCHFFRLVILLNLVGEMRVAVLSRSQPHAQIHQNLIILCKTYPTLANLDQVLHGELTEVWRCRASLSNNTQYSLW